LYTTSHGAPFGVVYNDGNEGFGAISPRRLAALLRAHGIERRLLIVSACYSGVFVPVLSGPQSAVVSAAASDRSSFGCAAENDWTFF
ncbi:C13 family peptidase, partial [Mycobacterium tuberculosis]|nr:C13 family peptidase [Mycobacterium tuberculosis]